MNIVCWNIRVVGRGPKLPIIRKLVSGQNLFFVGLIETKHKTLNIR